MVMNFTVTRSSGKFGNSFISPWTTIVPPLRFKASTPSKIGRVPAPAVQSRATSTPRPAVISLMGAPVGILAVAVLAQVAPLALAAHDVVLDEHEVAFHEAFAPGELATRLGDGADVLVAHDHGRVGRRR